MTNRSFLAGLAVGAIAAIIVTSELPSCRSTVPGVSNSLYLKDTAPAEFELGAEYDGKPFLASDAWKDLPAKSYNRVTLPLPST